MATGEKSTTVLTENRWLSIALPIFVKGVAVPHRSPQNDADSYDFWLLLFWNGERRVEV
jgi:hypothetical protein